MTQENIELHRRSVEAFNARDIDAFVALCHPQIELHTAVTVPGGAVYLGRQGVRNWHQDLEDGWGTELRIEPEAYFDIGEHTVTFHILQGSGRQSGADVAMPAAHLCRWRDRLMVYFKGYTQREAVFRDLGVSTEDLEPIEP